MSIAPNASPPQTLGRYELLTAVARGGMGQVWAGRLRGARGFNKLVAIKTLLPMPGSEGRLESMLLEEARIAALIHHPNVVQTLELGEHESTLYLVMEWVDGEPLSFIMNRAEERGRMPLGIGVNLVGQTLRGLDAAHELTDEAGAALGVVHRDVSPHNVLVTYSGVAKLVDFGIAKATNQGSSSTQTGEVKGKFSCMAPEQIRCESVDRRADIFAIGILLYTLTTGRHPFHSEHPAGLLHKIAGDDPAPRPSLLIPTYSRTLEAVVMKALDKDVEQRWASAREMLAALQRALPEAFAAGFENQVREFMTELVGDRAALRREALRRAQVAADSRTQSGSLPAVTGGPSQSASSLRAISIDQSAQVVDPQFSTQLATQVAARLTPQSSLRKWGTIVGAAVALAVLVAPRFLPRPDHAGNVASASGGLVELRSAPASASAAPEVGAAPGPVEPAAANSVRPDASAKVGVAPTSHVAPGVVPKARVQRARNRDLIAPDYAR